MKRVKGYFVLVIKQFDDTMFGADYHYTSWCIGWKKYCRYNNTKKLRIFETYQEAKSFKLRNEASNSHERCLEIVYLTTAEHSQDERLTENLTRWVQIDSEQDAVEFDQNQKTGQLETCSEIRAQQWDSTQFSSLFY